MYRVLRRKQRGGLRAVLGAAMCAPFFACAATDPTADLALLQDELWANETVLRATKDTLAQHLAAARFQLRWMEEIEPAGSGGLWEGMELLSRRPSPVVQRVAYDDLVIRNRLGAVVSNDATRRDLVAYFAAMSALEGVAEEEYRAVWTHYDSVLGPGEWRSIFDVDLGPESFPVDYRPFLQRLVDDNHGAVLRGLVRAQTSYLEQVEAEYERTQALLTALARL